MENSDAIVQHLKRTGLALWELLTIFGLAVVVYAEKLFRLVVPRPLKSLEGEVILLTGAGNGIGKQIAFQLANVGATLICWDNEGPANERTVAELKKKGTKAYSYTVDISDRETIRKAAAKVREDIGDVTVIINNAGIAPNGPFLEQAPETIEKTFQVNLFAHFWIIKEFLPSMIAKNHGHIVTTASLSSLVPAKEIAAYASSKHGVHGFLESLKMELAANNSQSKIQFTTVYPIFVQTRLMDGITLKPRFRASAPILTPEYVAEKTVEGFRRNYEHLCLPPSSLGLVMLRVILPAPIIKCVEQGLLHIEAVRHVNTTNGTGNGKKSK